LGNDADDIMAARDQTFESGNCDLGRAEEDDAK
jgi:hypothetical protein